MANPYAPNRTALKAAILARLARGARMNALAREPGMPSAATIRNWRRADPDFAKAVTEALSRGGGWRCGVYHEAVAEAFLARRRAGERIDSILRDPAMPSRKVYNLWKRHYGEFALEILRLRDALEPQRLRGVRARRRDFDRAVADRVLARLGSGETLNGLPRTCPDLPCRKVIDRWRRQTPEFDAEMRLVLKVSGRRRQRAKSPRARLQETICERVMRGASLRALGARPGMPHPQTMYRWVRATRAFARRIAEAREDREECYRDQLLVLFNTADPGGPLSPAVRQDVRRLEKKLEWLRRKGEGGGVTRRGRSKPPVSPG